MKRFSIMLAGLVASATLGTTLGFEGVAAAAKVKSGSIWTTSWSGGCIAETFVKVKKVRTFTSEFGDPGTWTGGGKTVTWTITGGPAHGASFTGTYSRQLREYSGMWTSAGIPVAVPATMVAGQLPGC